MKILVSIVLYLVISIISIFSALRIVGELNIIQTMSLLLGSFILAEIIGVVGVNRILCFISTFAVIV